MHSTLDARLGARLRTEREARGWSLTELARRSGVSRAMIYKVERGASSPTTALLARLAQAFGLTLSALLARAEGAGRGARLLRAAGQPQWHDPETGCVQRQLAPVTGSTLPLELVHVELPAGAALPLPHSTYRFIQQLVWVVKGKLTLVEGDSTCELGTGDCLELGASLASCFHNTTRAPCEYLLALLRG